MSTGSGTGDGIGVGAVPDAPTASEEDPWSLDPQSRRAPDPVGEADEGHEPAWYITRDGWMSAESVGTALRDRFATEDLESARWSRTRRIVAGLTTVTASVAVVVVMAIL